MKIVMAGSSGLIGRALCERFRRDQREVLRLVRKAPTANDERRWNPTAGEFNHKVLDGADVVINLAGVNVGSGRWGKKRKAAILESRVKSTKLLADAVAGMSEPPAAFINASAIGFYGDRGDEICDETSAQGTGFLPEVCADWEKEAMKASEKTRVACLRLGVVLSRKGGALKKMLLPFSLCLGGNIGSGKQYCSWVSIDDVCNAVCHVILTEQLSGPVNVVAPGAVTNAEFTRAIAGALGRPAFLPMPEFIVKLLFGQKGEELFLSSTRVSPGALTASGYRFIHPQLPAALKSVISKR